MNWTIAVNIDAVRAEHVERQRGYERWWTPRRARWHAPDPAGS